jgi:hypothetical protein
MAIVKRDAVKSSFARMTGDNGIQAPPFNEVEGGFLF